MSKAAKKKAKARQNMAQMLAGRGAGSVRVVNMGGGASSVASIAQNSMADRACGQRAGWVGLLGVSSWRSRAACKSSAQLGC